MIFIKRTKKDESGITMKPPDSWFTLAKNKTRKAITEGSEHEPARNVYGNDKLRAALKKLFDGKCAYCETSLSETDWDVEHFRPKGRVAENKNHPGYYWLAYTWENLYPSCKACNQNRRERPIWGDLTYRTAKGKADQFPLEDENKRAMTPDDNIEIEPTLLIDPCQDNPEKYLSVNPTGKIISINNNKRGWVTISVLNLDRRLLVRSYKKTINTTRYFLSIAKDLENKGDLHIAGKILKIIKDNITSDNAQNAGVARAVMQEPERFGL